MLTFHIAAIRTSPAKRATAVLIVDRDPRVRGALRGMIELVDDLRVVGEASSAEEALALDRRLVPEVVLLDLSLPTSADGVATLRELVARRRAVVATSIKGGLSGTAHAAGARAFVEKSRGAIEGLPEAIRAASGRSRPPGR
jgi:DNA-binding NarL/FixJ family response regulator